MRKLFVVFGLMLAFTGCCPMHHYGGPCRQKVDCPCKNGTAATQAPCGRPCPGTPISPTAPTETPAR